MKIERFIEIMKGRVGVDITPDYGLYSNPCGLENVEKSEVIMFDSLEDACEKAVIDGVPLKEIIENASEDDLFGAAIDDWDIRFPLG